MEPHVTATGRQGFFSDPGGWVETHPATGTAFSWFKLTDAGKREENLCRDPATLPDNVWEALAGYDRVDRRGYVEWKYYPTRDAALAAVEAALAACTQL